MVYVRGRALVLRIRGDLANACWRGDWEEARALIAENPWKVLTSRCWHGSAITAMAYHGCVRMLRFAYNAIANDAPDSKLKKVFEEPNSDGFQPVHAAAINGRLNCLEFLITHCPSGS